MLDGAVVFAVISMGVLYVFFSARVCLRSSAVSSAVEKHSLPITRHSLLPRAASVFSGEML